VGYRDARIHDNMLGVHTHELGRDCDTFGRVCRDAAGVFDECSRDGGEILG